MLEERDPSHPKPPPGTPAGREAASGAGGGSVPGHTSEVRMLSSSRSKAKGFSLSCWGSERCRRRGPGAGLAWRSVGTAGGSPSGAGSSPSAARCPSARGTGVQGCQEDVEGALPKTRRSSAGGRGCEGTEEAPGLATEPHLTKDISCKDRAQ